MPRPLFPRVPGMGMSETTTETTCTKIDYEINEKLVTAIQNYPLLYDVSMPSYKIRRVRDNCWHKISASTSLPVDFCKMRWKNLRDGFIRRQKTPAGRKLPAWPYDDLMSFLVPFYRLKRSFGRYPFLYLRSGTSNVSQPSSSTSVAAPSENIVTSDGSVLDEPADDPVHSAPDTYREPEITSVRSVLDEPPDEPVHSAPDTYREPEKTPDRSVLDELADDPVHSAPDTYREAESGSLVKRRKREEFWEKMVRQVVDQECDTSLEASMGLLIGRLLKRIPEPRKTQLFQRMVNDLCSETVLPAVDIKPLISSLQ
ncbi:hypothetical protein CDAR_189121 [Caerostris darwini]|uniref:MADF domain-containing protein n=1 Tax=Caerostris darwini TaxID=1538125 RepID=A0AAV4SN38_9ARAC|nr:hypothetical protein CDAR_189121 [Caerostris darwini]